LEQAARLSDARSFEVSISYESFSEQGSLSPVAKLFSFATSRARRLFKGCENAKMSRKSSFFCTDFCQPLSKGSFLPEIFLKR
jgi:hypothetical protein